MTANVLNLATTKKDGLTIWLENQGEAIERTVKAVNAITDSDDLTVSKFAVAAGLLSDLSKS
jgi:glutamate dehydrogenase